MDFQFENHGSICLVRPFNKTARKHLQENVSEEAQWFGGALVVEPRYMDDLATGLESEGFTIGWFDK
jgi:hypothetical protein